MKKFILCMSVVLATVFSANAQGSYRHNIYSSPPGSVGLAWNDEVGTLVRACKDGTGDAVIAAYRADLDVNGDINGSHFIVYKVDKNGTILWELPLGLPDVNSNDILTDMIITQNGDVVVVGTIGRANSPSQNNQPFIARIDGAGGWVGDYSFPALTDGGEHYFGVCELTNGDIVAVGTYNKVAGVSSGFLSVFEPNLTLRYHRIMDQRRMNGSVAMSPVSDEFRDVVAHGDDVLIVGEINGNGKHNVTMTYFTPGTSYSSSNVAWSVGYNPVYTLSIDGVDYDLIDQRAEEAWIRNDGVDDYLIILTLLDDEYYNPNASTYGIVRVPFTSSTVNIASAETWALPAIDGGTGFPYQFANCKAMYPVTENHFFTIQNPGATSFDPEFNGNRIAYPRDAWLSEITDISSLNVDFTRTLEIVPDQEAILDMDYHDGYLYMVGYREEVENGTTYGGTDIFYSVTKAPYWPSDGDGQVDCEHPDETVNIETVSAIDYELGIFDNTINPQQPLLLVGFDEFLQIFVLCGSDILKPGRATTIQELNSDGMVNIYPNPSNGVVNIDYNLFNSSTGTIFITDVTGRVIVEKSLETASGQVSIMLDASGVYICSIVDDKENKVHTQKVVITK